MSIEVKDVIIYVICKEVRDEEIIEVKLLVNWNSSTINFKTKINYGINLY